MTAGGTLNLGGSGIAWADSGSTFTAGTGTVNYNRAGAQTANGVNYYNLTFSGSGAKTLGTGTTAIGGNLTLSGTATTTTVVGLGVTGNLSVGDGTTFTAAGFALTVTGTTTVGGGASGNLTISSATGAKSFASVTVNGGGTWDNSGNAAVGISGDLANSGTFTAGSGTYTLSGLTKTISGTISIPSVSVSGTYANNGTLTVGTALAGTGTLTQGTSATLNIGGTSGIGTLTATATGNTVNFNGTAQTVNNNNYHHLTLSGSGAKTLQTGTTTIGGNLSLSGTATATTVVGLAVSGNLSAGDGTTFTAAGFNLTVTGTTTVGGGASGNLTISSATGTKIFAGLVTVNSGGTWANTSANSAVTFRGGITLTGTGAFNAGTGVHTFDTSAQSLTGTFSIPNVTVTGVTLNNTGTLTVGTALAGTGNLTQGASATLNIGGTSGITTLTATASGNTVNFNGAAQTVNPVAYHHLTLSGSGTKTTTGVATINGNLLANGSVTAEFSSNLAVGGNVTQSGSGSLTLSGNNTIGGVTTLNGSGILRATSNANSLGGGATTLTLASGTLELANNTGLGFNRDTTVSGTTTIKSDRLSAGAGVTHTMGTLSIGGFQLNVRPGGFVDVDSAYGLTFGATTLTGNATFDVANNGTGVGTLTLGAVGETSGPRSLTKANTGTLILSAAGSYSGVTTISGGILEVRANDALGTVANGTTVSSGGTLRLQSGLNYATTEALFLNGTGAGGVGALTTTGGSVTYAGQVTIASHATINSGGGTLTLTGGVVKNGTTATFTGGGTININGVGISGSSANSDLVVDGTEVVLNVANTYNGPTTVQNSGTLKLGASNVLPTSPQTALTLNTSGALDLASHSDSVASLTGDSSGVVKNTTASSTGTLTVNPASGSTTFAGTISGTAGGDVALVKSGAGTLVLSGASTYSGATAINQGAINMQHASALGSGGVTVADGAALEVQNNITVAAKALALSGTGLSGAGALHNVSGANSWAGAITLNAASRINSDSDLLTLSGGIVTASGKGVTVGGSGTVTFETVAISGAGSLTKDGSGTVNLNAVNTYSGGTTLSEGTMMLGVNDALGTGGLIFAGGLLDANNKTDSSIGALSLTANSTLALHAGTPGTLTFDSATATAGAILTITGWTGTANTAGTDDRIFVGGVNPGAAFLSQIHFSGYADGAAYLVGGEIVPAPEPINVALGLFGAVFAGVAAVRKLRARAQA